MVTRHKTDEALTAILSCDFSTAISMLSVLYEYKPNQRVAVFVCSVKTCEVSCSKDLVLVIRDKITNRWIGLRLATVSKILRFVGSKKLFLTRNLTLEEMAAMF